MTEPIPGTRLADSPIRPEGYPLDLVWIEEATPSDERAWRIAGAGLRHGNKEWWLEAPTGGSFEYWWEKDTNGYSSAVFHYYVRDESVAQQLVEQRRLELAAGATPFTTLPMTEEVADALGISRSGQEPEGELESESVLDPAQNNHRDRSHAMSSALVWRLASELVRRHPERLWVHPEGGGMYDRVTVIDQAADPPTWVMTMNAAGSNSAFKSGSTMRWSDAFNDGADPVDWVRRAEQMCGLPSPSKPLPASTPQSLVPRFIAVFLTMQLGSRSAWLPQSFAASERDSVWRDTLGAIPGYEPEIVFLRRASEATPRLALTSEGVLFRRDGQRTTLTDHHRSGDSIVSLLLKTVPELLP